jgi:hypothetical protein
MPTEIRVGTPLLTINEGATFMVTDLDGQMAAESELGVFADDTRFVSYYSISADGNAWRRLRLLIRLRLISAGIPALESTAKGSGASPPEDLLPRTNGWWMWP